MPPPSKYEHSNTTKKDNNISAPAGKAEINLLEKVSNIDHDESLSMLSFIVNEMSKRVKDVICLGPTMNRSCTKICATASLLYCCYTAALLSAQLPTLPDSSLAMVYLQTVTTTVFFTISAMFLFMRYFSTNTSQNTTSAFGLLTSCLMGVSHLLELIGAAPFVQTINGRYGSLIRNGEWIVCLPLLTCMFGHVFKLQERSVLVGAGFQGLAAAVLLVATFSSSPVIVTICGVFWVLLFLPVLVVLLMLSFQLQHLISISQLRELQLYGWTNLTVYILYGMFYFSNTWGFLPILWQRIFTVAFDLLWVVLLFALIFGSQYKCDVSSFEIKLVDMEKANSAQKLFLRFVFHEVRVPFHSLLLGLEHLATQPGLEEHHVLMEMLINSAEMMERTINDVLLLSRLEDRKLELEAAPFSVFEMTRLTLKSFHPMAQEKNVSLALQIDPSFPYQLLGDQHRISQVLANLVSNGLKFSKEGDNLDVFINVLDLSTHTCYFQMKVQDEGIGMTPEDQSLLFRPFSQIRPHQNQAGRGSGLGLSIVKHIVELYDGSISVLSEYGKGSTFFVRMKLPIVPCSVDKKREASREAEPINEESNSHDASLVMQQTVILPPTDVDFNLEEQGLLGTSMKMELSATRKVTQEGCSPHSRRAKPTIVPVDHNSLMSSLDQSQDRLSRCYENYIPTRKNRISRYDSYLSEPTPRSGMSTRRRSTLDAQRNPPAFYSPPLKKFESDLTQMMVMSAEEKLGMKCVLVVDDSQMNRKLTRMILEQQGLTVDEACNGQEAVDMAQKKEYWVIFMDNSMPVMDGVEATRQITGARSCVVIGLTGNSLDEDVSEFLKAGATEVLIKPCRKEKILRVLSTLSFSN